MVVLKTLIKRRKTSWSCYGKNPLTYPLCNTFNTVWENQPYLTQSNWNMDEILGLKYQLSYVNMPQKGFSEIPPCAGHVIFVTEFIFLSTNPPIYEVCK